MTDKLDQLNKLIAEQDDAQRQAVQPVRDAYTRALEAAEALDAEVAEECDDSARFDALRDIIEAAASRRYKSASSKQQAGLIAQQFAQARADDPGVPASISRDGASLLATCVSGTAGYHHEQREKVFSALVVAAGGGAETGLLELPKDWASHVKLTGLDAMARTLAPDEVQRLDDEQAAKAQRLAEVRARLEALRQAKPAFFTVGENPARATFTVRSHRAGSLGIRAGVRFDHGDNELDAQQYAAAQQDDAFQAYVGQGLLEVVSASNTVQEV